MSAEPNNKPSVFAVANEVIKIARERGEPLTHLQLQKLVYIMQGYSLSILNDSLFDEEIYAWKYGPVIPGLYHKLKRNGMRPITKSITSEDEVLREDHKKIISSVFEVYGYMNAKELVGRTHLPTSPWAKTKNEGKEIIDTELMRKYYSNETI